MEPTRQRDVLMRSLSDFARTLLVTYDIDFVLDGLLDRLVDVLDLAGAGISLAEDGRLQDTHTTAPELSALEDVQLKTLTGPCVVAFHTGRTFPMPDISEWQDRWPRYCEVAHLIGIRAAVGVPMQLGDHTFGAVNLYSGVLRSWSSEDLELAGLVRDMACGYLVNVTKLRQQQELTDQLQNALRTRVVIEQAKGLLAAAEHISLQQAFERIRATSRSQQRALREVAGDLVRDLQP